MSEYTTYIGVEHLRRIETCTSICFDCETLQLQPEVGKLRLLQFGSQVRKTIVVVDLFDTDDAGFKKLDLFFKTPRTWLAHNAIFDLGWCAAYGWHPGGQIHDSMLASKLIYNGQSKIKHGLAQVSERVLKIELDKTQQKSDWSGELDPEQIKYAAKDVEVLCEIDGFIHTEIVEERLAPAYSMECRVLPALTAMQNTGLPFDRSKLLDVERDYEKDIENLGREFHLELDEALPDEHKLPRDPDGSLNLRASSSGSKTGKQVARFGEYKPAGFNINSPKQLVEKLELILGKAPVDPKTERPSASRTVLREYAGEHQVISTYLEWKKAEKRRQMVASLLEHQSSDGYIRASYWQLGTETGRMSCSNPNAQQIPRDEQFRSAVVAPAGWLLLDADFSQMELRIAAWIAKDQKMMQAFRDGKDLHTATAEAIGCSRQVAKSANFGLLYGSGAKGLSNYAAGMGVRLSEEEAGEVRKKWLHEYDGIKRWHHKLALEANETEGKVVSIYIPQTKMRRYLIGDMNRLTIRANTPVQGAGAAILKLALSNLWRCIKGKQDEVKLCAAIHDELLLLVKEEHAKKYSLILKGAMEQAEEKWLGVDIPAVADVQIGTTWAEVH